MVLKTIEPEKLDPPPVELGKEGNFELLFKRYYRSISYFFANRGFSQEESRDLAQETFLRAYAGLERFRRESSVETWLFKIATNIWHNKLRSLSAEKRIRNEVSLATLHEEGQEVSSSASLHTESPEVSPLDEALTDEKTRLLRQAIGELPDQMRRCLQLRIDRELKYREIAAVMRISVDTVKSQLFQAKERLRDQLSDYLIDFED